MGAVPIRPVGRQRRPRAGDVRGVRGFHTGLYRDLGRSSTPRPPSGRHREGGLIADLRRSRTVRPGRTRGVVRNDAAQGSWTSAAVPGSTWRRWCRRGSRCGRRARRERRRGGHGPDGARLGARRPRRGAPGRRPRRRPRSVRRSSAVEIDLAPLAVLCHRWSACRCCAMSSRSSRQAGSSSWSRPFRAGPLQPALRPAPARAGGELRRSRTSTC